MCLKIEDLAIGDWVQAVTYILDGEERLTPPAYVSAIDQSGSVSLMFDPEAATPTSTISKIFGRYPSRPRY